MTASPTAGGLCLAFAGRLDAAAAAKLWADATRRAQGANLMLDLGGLEVLDTAGAALLLRLEALAAHAERRNLPDGAIATMLEHTETALAKRPPAPPAPLGFIPATGRAVVERLHDWADNIAFFGGGVMAMATLLPRPRRFRFGEWLRHLDEAGTRAFPLTVMLGLLIGVIMAFQSAAPMRRFGAETYIPNLVGISLLRELGPLMAAVILSGRTGSAFAAELGTMTVNEEVDALRIMGIDPIAWLVLPRLFAAMLVLPVLALVMDLAGLIGMGAVMKALGYPVSMVVASLKYALVMKDLLGGLFKAAIFGLAIGFVACRAGLTAGRGPRAVGDAATAAVVGGIVITVLLDGVFAALFHQAGM